MANEHDPPHQEEVSKHSRSRRTPWPTFVWHVMKKVDFFLLSKVQTMQHFAYALRKMTLFIQSLNVQNEPYNVQATLKKTNSERGTACLAIETLEKTSTLKKLICCITIIQTNYLFL